MQIIETRQLFERLNDADISQCGKRDFVQTKFKRGRGLKNGNLSKKPNEKTKTARKRKAAAESRLRKLDAKLFIVTHIF